MASEDVTGKTFFCSIFFYLFSLLMFQILQTGLHTENCFTLYLEILHEIEFSQLTL